MRSSWTAFLSLFTSVGTLVCCALPALFVSLGLGAALAGLVTKVPQLVWLSERKAMVFGVAGLLIILAIAAQWYGNRQPCPVDLLKAKACTKAKKISQWVLVFSVGIYMVGAFFAFAAPYIL